MTLIDTLIKRHAAFTSSEFSAELKIIPSLKMMLVGCVDPRVDPADILGLSLGEAAVIRNVGGRITPDTLDTIAMLRTVAKAGGGELGLGWNLIVLHHTDCGITRLKNSPEQLAKYFGVSASGLEALAINDPHASVVVDVAALKANPTLPGGFMVSGLVYDVGTGKLDVVVPPALLRSETAS